MTFFARLLTGGKLLFIGVIFFVISSKIGGRVYVQLPNRSSKQVSRAPVVVDKHTFVGMKMRMACIEKVNHLYAKPTNWGNFREIDFQTVAVKKYQYFVCC